jgi:hypothetical protein
MMSEPEILRRAAQACCVVSHRRSGTEQGIIAMALVWRAGASVARRPEEAGAILA